MVDVLVFLFFLNLVAVSVFTAGMAVVLVTTTGVSFPEVAISRFVVSVLVVDTICLVFLFVVTGVTMTGLSCFDIV